MNMTPSPTFNQIRHVVENMRDVDRREIFATQPSDDVDLYASQVSQLSSNQWVAWHGALPAAIIGAWPVWPGVWNVYAFGTDKWDKVALSLTKHGRRVIVPSVIKSGGHRLQCNSHVDHKQAHLWLERAFGAKIEATLQGYGRNREDFYSFALMV
jgi:hypothetical protein